MYELNNTFYVFVSAGRISDPTISKDLYVFPSEEAKIEHVANSALLIGFSLPLCILSFTHPLARLTKSTALTITVAIIASLHGAWSQSSHIQDRLLSKVALHA